MLNGMYWKVLMGYLIFILVVISMRYTPVHSQSIENVTANSESILFALVIEQDVRNVNGCIENNIQIQESYGKPVNHSFGDGKFISCTRTEGNSTLTLPLLSRQEEHFVDKHQQFKARKLVLFLKERTKHDLIFYETVDGLPAISKNISLESKIYVILPTKYSSKIPSMIIAGILHPNLHDISSPPDDIISYEVESYELTNLGTLFTSEFLCPANWKNCTKAQTNITYEYNLAWDDSIVGYDNRYSKVHSISQSCVELNENGKWVKIVEVKSDQLQSIRCQGSSSVLFNVEQHVEVKRLGPYWLTFFTLSKVFVGISTLFLLVTVILLIQYRAKLSSHRVYIQLSISLSFMGQQLVILLYIAVRMSGPYPGHLCEVMAIANLFFTVTGAFWLLCEGIVLYVKVGMSDKVSYTKAFSTRRMAVLTTGIWLFSGIYVSAIAFPTYKAGIFLTTTNLYNEINEKNLLLTSYGESTIFHMEKYVKYYGCHPSHKNFLVYLISAPTVIALLVNFAIAAYIVSVVWQKSIAGDSSRPSKDYQATICAIKTTTHAVVFLVWSLGFPQFVRVLLNILDHNAEAYVLNSILNTVQGPLVFYFYCIKNTELRLAIRRKRKRKKLQKAPSN